MRLIAGTLAVTANQIRLTRVSVRTSSKDEVLEHRRSSELGVRQDAAAYGQDRAPDTHGKDTNFRKYARPALLFSKNLGRNLSSSQLAVCYTLYEMGGCSQTALLGGNVGIAAPAFGNVIKSFLRKSSNSEYLDQSEDSLRFCCLASV